MTTGGSTRETIEVARAAGATVVARPRSSIAAATTADLGVPFHALLPIDLPTYDPAACPLCAQGVPVVKPGRGTDDDRATVRSADGASARPHHVHVGRTSPVALGRRCSSLRRSRPVRTLKLTLQYDGTELVGWQRQKTGDSVQGLLEDALSRIDGAPSRCTAPAAPTPACTRSRRSRARDVHDALDPATIARALNAQLPPDGPRHDALRRRRPSFHARFSARGKTYRYLDARGPTSPVHSLRRYAWRVPGSLDVDAMREAAGALRGTHDFTRLPVHRQHRGACHADRDARRRRGSGSPGGRRRRRRFRSPRSPARAWWSSRSPPTGSSGTWSAPWPARSWRWASGVARPPTLRAVRDGLARADAGRHRAGARALAGVGRLLLEFAVWFSR